MNKQVGIWIDHRAAFIVLIGEGGESTELIESGVEKHVRFSGHARSEEGTADDQVDRQFTAHLDGYYDEVISRVRDAKSLLIFGPGEAKGEFEKRLIHQGLGGHIVGIETTDKMTNPQIVAKVRQFYQ
ncbi:MAG: hypothetical protein DM484_26970 [Candidatus Methylumidiphilus alinenensis]|uniref:Translational machinery protein n=1 Tax=Candidatus Methylumidiphilus alinenensis TaxID=2202197 RepID=A0A2W4QFT6_9GAMM|nr:MAG: hypothetical protein DM484_26970 [Candidatus Methylumidiphilus alinenensis]